MLIKCNKLLELMDGTTHLQRGLSLLSMRIILMVVLLVELGAGLCCCAANSVGIYFRRR
jgi:hypothetical protein